MKTFQFKALPAVLIAAFIGVASVSMAQNTPPPAATPAAGAPAPGGGDREAFRQRMNERLKTSLKVTDDEWSIIQPLLENVQKKQREVMMNRMAGMFGHGNRGGGGADTANKPNRPDRPERPTAPEIEALKTALETDGTPTDDIKSKLETVRAARKKAEADLNAACDELRKVLTLRQEAVLVMMGILQ